MNVLLPVSILKLIYPHVCLDEVPSPVKKARLNVKNPQEPDTPRDDLPKCTVSECTQLNLQPAQQVYSVCWAHQVVLARLRQHLYTHHDTTLLKVDSMLDYVVSIIMGKSYTTLILIELSIRLKEESGGYLNPIFLRKCLVQPETSCYVCKRHRYVNDSLNISVDLRNLHNSLVNSWIRKVNIYNYLY